MRAQNVHVVSRRALGAARALIAAIACANIAGCADASTTVTASFQTPMGLALAGEAHDLLFVANQAEDSLHVIELREDLTDLRFVTSPARYFPLRIPAGPAPTDVAATPDGRYVVVLDGATAALRLVRAADADAIAVVRELADSADSATASEDAASAPAFELRLGGAVGTAPAALVASPVGCDAPCVGRVYVALPDAGSIAAVMVSDDAAAPLQVEGYFAVGGAPWTLAVHPEGTWLFASDADGERVVRVDLVAGAIDAIDVGDVGGRPGPLAVSTDGRFLVVGRPSQRDIVIVGGVADATPSLVDANAEFVPVPSCLVACDDPAALTCDDAHPADRALCRDADQALQTPVELTAYQGVFLDLRPSRIITLGQGAGHPALNVHCGEDNATHTEYAVVTGLDGTMRVVALTDADGAPDARLVDDAWCKERSVTALPESATVQGGAGEALSSFLQPCVAAPSDRRRFVCAGDEPEQAGVLVLPGQAESRDWVFDWEGVLVDRPSGGGEFVGPNTFVDAGFDLLAAGVQVGDLVHIVTIPRADAGCSTVRCSYERRIIEITAITAITDAADGDVRLELDGEALGQCFHEGGVVAYQVRAGDSFLTALSGGERVRVRPGQQIGPAGDLGTSEGVIFALRDLTATQIGAGVAACERYHFTDGRAGAPRVEGMLPMLQRDVGRIGFRITEPFEAIRLGVSVDQRTTPIGRMPSAMAVWSSPAGAPIVFTSYAGTNSVLGFVAHDNAQYFGANTYRLFR